ncbi:AIG2-like protein [Annulohypoxylon moriforme]|nr:AIG2-like protein [Annulohypoxylon moriforme]
MSESKPRPLFIYGTLRSLPLLAWVLTGDPTNVSAVSQLIQPAKVYGYKRFALRDRDYPAAVKHDPHSSVDGYLLTLETTSQRNKLDGFEGEIYEAVAVDVIVFDPDDNALQETVEADIYRWAGDLEVVTTDPWELEDFERERLDDWLDLFGGMEFLD